MSDAEDAPHYLGHRDRLRTRFREGGPDALPDYEMLELLLFYAIPRRDLKPLAKRLIDHFKSFGGVLSADAAALKQFGLTDTTITLLQVVRSAAVRLARAELHQREVLESWAKVLDYCRARLQYAPTESFHLLFLDRKNALIADEAQQKGTVDHTPVYPREVVKRALELGATAVIMVHNHPSGDPTPSRADIEMTKAVQNAAAALGIAVHDHIIIGKHGHASFRALGLL